MKKNIILLILLVMLSGCNSLSSVITTEISNSTNVAMPSISPTNQILSTSTCSSTIQPPTQQVQTNTPTPTTVSLSQLLNPSVVQVCPKQPELPLDNLNMDSEYKLLVIPPDIVYGAKIQSGISVISDANPTPTVIEKTIQTNDWYIDKYRVSPDGKWLTFDRFKNNEMQHDIWLSSIDGEQVQKIQSVEMGTQIDWISKDKLILVGLSEEVTDGSNYFEQIMPQYIYDLQTSTLQALSPKPSGSIYETFFVSQNTYYSIFFNYLHTGDGHFENFILYDYNQNISTPIFKWLVESSKANFFNTEILKSYAPNGEVQFSVVIDRPYGFDYAKNLSLEKVTSPLKYDEVMHQIAIPLEYNFLSHIQLGMTDFMYLEPHQNYFETDKSKFYIFDTSEMIIKDYCFTIDSGTKLQASPDGKFIAFTKYENNGITAGNAKEVIIFNLDNGYFSRIPNIQAIGWGLERTDSLP